MMRRSTSEIESDIKIFEERIKSLNRLKKNTYRVEGSNSKLFDINLDPLLIPFNGR